jgi:Ca2+-binding RTX toxin-like protein
VTLTNCTVSGNSATAGNGGGLYNKGGKTKAGNTIVAGNTASSTAPDAQGPFVSLGHNLIGKTNGSTGWLSSDRKGTVAHPLDPKLDTNGLQNNGGPTLTMALLAGSPAIGKGSNSLVPAGLTTDERGAGFSRLVGKVDIGAYEFPADMVSGTLFVVGTPSDDTITIAKGTTSSTAVVTRNNVNLGTFSGVLRVDVRAGAGNDNVSLTNGLAKPATLVGGSGKDTLTGGNGSNVLLGGAGDDSLTGGNGRDLIVGGTGTDNLTGGGGDDLLIGGTLSYYNEATDSPDTTNLGLVMQEWTGVSAYKQRISHLLNGGGLNGKARINSKTVAQDGGKADTLTGGLGQDWFVISSEDGTDQAAGETTTTV